MKKYDYTILGGGCAGLSLAYELNKNGILDTKNLAIVEKRKSYSRDKTWSFWKTEDHNFSDCVSKSWNNFYLKNGNDTISINCDKYPYQSIDSNLFYSKILTSLKKNNNIHFYNDLNDIDTNDTIIFNSAKRNFKSKGYWQHFYGIEIETDDYYFDDSKFCLMDFDNNCDKDVHFFYMLPFNHRKALIETTWISKNKSFNIREYMSQINGYLKLMGIENFSISFKEIGSIPLFSNSIKNKKNEVLIGTCGNMTRSSTGYTFLNIQRHSKYIVKNIEKILNVPHYRINNKYKILDHILFNVIENYSSKMPSVFTSLFSRNTQSVIRFLSDKSTLLDDFSVVMNMPKNIFLRSALK